MAMYALMAAVLMTTAGAEDKPSGEDPAASARKVKELRKERITVLQSAVNVSTKLAQSARIEVWEAVVDRLELLKAELEDAGTEADRITLYKQAIDSLKGYEALAKAGFEAGRGSERHLYKMKARRLEVEIQLEQARMREAKRPE